MKWMNERIEWWHHHAPAGMPLSQALGMSNELYARYAETPPKLVLGIDEVGYGALAGPLVVGGCLAPANWNHPLLKDSKAFKGKDGKAELARASVLAQLPKDGAKYFISRTAVEDVDRLGVYAALMKAFRDIVDQAYEPGTLIVLDGDERLVGIEHVALPKADSFVPQVSAASIIAKVTRDTEMRAYEQQYPGYLFAKHKGYGTDEHQEAIKARGLCPIHRRSYKMKFLESSSSS